MMIYDHSWLIKRILQRGDWIAACCEGHQGLHGSPGDIANAGKNTRDGLQVRRGNFEG